MRRREFLGVLSGAAAAWPLSTLAQQPERVRRIGVLSGATKDTPDLQVRLAAFQQVLQQLGWTDGRNVRIDYRWGAGRPTTFADTRRNWWHSRRTSSWQQARLWSRCFRQPAPCRSSWRRASIRSARVL